MLHGTAMVLFLLNLCLSTWWFLSWYSVNENLVRLPVTMLYNSQHILKSETVNSGSCIIKTHAIKLNLFGKITFKQNHIEILRFSPVNKVNMFNLQYIPMINIHFGPDSFYILSFALVKYISWQNDAWSKKQSNVSYLNCDVSTTTTIKAWSQ